VARQQVENGAQVIDINMDEAMLDSAGGDGALPEPDRRRARHRPRAHHGRQLQVGVIEAGLKCIQGKGIVNSISMKEGEAEVQAPGTAGAALRRAAVVMAFDEQGQADTYERKIEICERAYRAAGGRGRLPARGHHLRPQHLRHRHRHPEHDNYAVDFIKATRWIKQNLPGAKVSGGVSNVSFSFRGNDPVREAIHTVFLYHAIRPGWTWASSTPAWWACTTTWRPSCASAWKTWC
jgi:5-methyltetrahydrofolate--homocysteine methyltransferase